jgi:RNase P subunit RPR2
MEYKTIELPVAVKTVETVKEKKVRLVINQENLTFNYNIDVQYGLLCADSSNNPIYKTMVQQIQTKLNGYKSQDVLKELYDATQFVTLQSTLSLLITSEMKCFYCKEPVQVLYQHVREPKQWTLERIDNKHGHNDGNVEIACLSCNLRRRTMYHERFVFTKQLTIVKTG